MASDGICYKDINLIVPLKRVSDEDDSLVLDIPFEIYMCDVMYKGERLSYPVTGRPELEGQEVLAAVAIRKYHHVPSANRDDEPLARSLPGWVEDYHTDPRVAVHQPVMEE